MITHAALTRVDELFARFHAEHGVPGIAYGIVDGDELAHVRGLGTTRVGMDLPPDRNSVFRIASMTKSFTAALVLLLRDEGSLRLDDPVVTWVPELAGLHGPTADSPAVTLRHLLTMNAGFPTDDPWGDRQQSLSPERFAELLRTGLTFAWPPGTCFEYSNLGYAILGRAIEGVTGVEYRAAVRERLLEPLGMHATAFDAAEVPDRLLVRGYAKREHAWLEQPMDGYGAFAPMGGLFSSVDDLARWVAGFAGAFPARNSRGTDHPLARSTRREMQQVHCMIEPALTFASPDLWPSVGVGGYGFGLFVEHDLSIGRIVGHNGGYPGFGSHMCWHPATGIGVVVLANGRYAPVKAPAREALSLLVAGSGTAVRAAHPCSATVAAMELVERLLAHWDDELAAELFAMNVDLDEPLDRRRAEIDRLRAALGELRREPGSQVGDLSPTRATWWMTGERGRLRVEIALSPEHPPRVQLLKLTGVPRPSRALLEPAREITALLGRECPRLPAGLAFGDEVDRRALLRTIRWASAILGRATLGPAVAGDGVRDASFEVHGARGVMTLVIEVDERTERIARVTFEPIRIQGARTAG